MCYVKGVANVRVDLVTEQQPQTKVSLWEVRDSASAKEAHFSLAPSAY